MSAGRRLKVMTLLGTRPEVVKMSRILAELDAHTEHVLVHSNQNADYELNRIFFDQLGLRLPDHVLDVAAATPAETIARVIAQADAVMAEVKPDALVLYGDTNTGLGVIPAKRRRIPVFHLEAGNRCFDERVPEEINRRLIDHLSDVNLTLTEHARRYLLAEGRRPETVIKIGSPMKEVLEHYRERIDASRVVADLGLTAGRYFVASAHREENVDDPRRLAALVAALVALAREHDARVVVSTHPRTVRRLAERAPADRGAVDERVTFAKPFGFFDYIHLQQRAACVLSDSGTLTEEAALLGFPAVMLRDAHERPEGMDEGVTIMAGLDPDRVLAAVALARAHAAGRPVRLPADYDVDDVARKVVRIVVSYVDYVNRVVWRRPD